MALTAIEGDIFLKLQQKPSFRVFLECYQSARAGASTNQRISGFIPGSASPNVNVSEEKTLNPELFPMDVICLNDHLALMGWEDRPLCRGSIMSRVV